MASALLALLLPHADTHATRLLLMKLTWSAQVRTIEMAGGAAGTRRTFEARSKGTLDLASSAGLSGYLGGNRFGAEWRRVEPGIRFGRTERTPRYGHAPAATASGLAAKGSRVGQRGARGLILAVASALLALLLTTLSRSW